MLTAIAILERQQTTEAVPAETPPEEPKTETPVIKKVTPARPKAKPKK
jgi:hypothetical protein